MFNLLEIYISDLELKLMYNGIASYVMCHSLFSQLHSTLKALVHNCLNGNNQPRKSFFSPQWWSADHASRATGGSQVFSDSLPLPSTPELLGMERWLLTTYHCGSGKNCLSQNFAIFIFWWIYYETDWADPLVLSFFSWHTQKCM